MADWSPLRALLADVESSVTLAWDELDTLVGGLPKSAYVHNAFWKGQRSTWFGFTTTSVTVGGSVTFVRRGAPPEAVQSTPLTQAAPAPGAAPDLVLIGCVKQKLDAAAPARDLYTSWLFRKERAYAELVGVPWFILSAQHGLVHPDDVLQPYNLHLASTSSAYRRSWGARVIDQLHEAVGPIRDTTIEVHAGSAYTAAIRNRLTEEGATVVEPLAGLTMGARLHWYTTAGQTGSGSSRRHATPSDDAALLVTRLTLEGQAITPQQFLVGGRASLRSPGLYSWWVDSRGAADLSRGLGHRVEPGLIYAGLAGATRSRSGRRSQNTLWGRITSMHLGGRHQFSTFRLSLGSILAEARGDDDIDENALTAWMHEHLRVLAVPVDDADTLSGLETAVLAQLDPPLNLDKVDRNEPRRARLSALRKKYSRRA